VGIRRNVDKKKYGKGGVWIRRSVDKEECG
jgi:hypothetical protein